MFLIGLFAAFGVLVLISRGEESNASDGSGSNAETWKNEVEKAIEKTGSDAKGGSTSEQTFIDLYKRAKEKSQVEGEPDALVGYAQTGRGEHPPEYPTGDDYGPVGDMDAMPRDLHDIAHEALVGLEDPADLFDVADSIEGAGFPIAAVRLKKKALRIIAETNQSTLDD